MAACTQRHLSKPLLIGLLDIPRFPDSAWSLLPAVTSYTDALLLRHKLATPNQLWHVARRVRELVPDVPLWINGPLEVALATQADGWHLPAGQMAASLMRPHWDGLLSAAAHTAQEAHWHHGADVLVWGHAFRTRSKPGVPPRNGSDAVIVSTTKPVLAIGGINPTTVPQLSGQGLSGVVAADGIWMATNPIEAACQIRWSIDVPVWSHGVQGKEK